MKIKKLLIPLLLIISCILAFSACSKDANLNFDENSTVILSYTCVDEEKNFDAELNAEQSREFILSLNKITYSEVTDKDIQFGPSYDCLNIKINNETLSLFDVAYKINYGGYFYINGKLCQSEEKFSFLEPYFVEYCPDNIPDKDSGVQYVESTICWIEEAYANGLITKDDLRSIAYYFNGEGSETDFVPMPKTPKSLSDETIKKIKQTYFNKAGGEKTEATVDDVDIAEYYGTYNGYVIVEIGASCMSSIGGDPLYYPEYVIGDVIFYSYTPLQAWTELNT